MATKASSAEIDWVALLKHHVEQRPMTILRLSQEEWQALSASRKGIGEFTIALPHEEFEHLRAPTLCAVLAEDEDEYYAYLGVIGDASPITTLQSRVKIRRAVTIFPPSPDALTQVLVTAGHRTALETRLAHGARLTTLSPKLSAELVEGLAAIEANAGAMRSLAAGLTRPRKFGSNSSFQDDAIRTALKAFGLGSDDRAQSVELVAGRETGLARVPIVEDGVIEHDARVVPGYDFAGSDLTGRAVFTRGPERLEVFTANKRKLEQAFGVDLIYLNVTRRNIVMLQYKMLEPPRGKSTDWTFAPDAQLAKELIRMRRFNTKHPPPAGEYRFNPSVFYLKFVKRDGASRQTGIILPIDHYDMFVQLPVARGVKGGIRVSYQALGGSYMREGPFLDLIRAGYVGAYSDTTKALETLVRGILSRGRAVVAAIQTSTEVDEDIQVDDVPDNLTDGGA